MADRLIRIRNIGRSAKRRPVLLAIAGDSASGKSTVAGGLVAALGPQRCVSISTDDYHRFDRSERVSRHQTPLHPDSNYLEILAQHLQLLATGQPILKPVYDHRSGLLLRPQLIEPREFVIVEGLLSLHNSLARACFDIAVYLDPDEEVRRQWKIQRDTTTRGYTTDQVLAELAERTEDAVAHVHPQQPLADVVVRFAPIAGRHDPPGTPLSAALLLRPTITQPDLVELLPPGAARAMHMRLAHDGNGRPVDSVHVHGYAAAEERRRLEKVLWHELTGEGSDMPDSLGRLGSGAHSTPLAVTQMLLWFHLLQCRR
ncbi:phosphoribulokinase [Mycobacterium sp. MS1601]|uniref:phosphoribulokinase n=1 Tax=Mycobacterium sp. MS1601 TaxID=1936029 RepID=UPI0009795811|nr:phosphoribulokinase [Mycobacterium sp. MS1601]AQA05240.1 phosphoribulokinase [Mycobacterium sp. MS1601]